jgi:hypothetical protein
MTRREQFQANRKSLARLHMLECYQLIIDESTLKKCRQLSGGSRTEPTGSPQEVVGLPARATKAYCRTWELKNQFRPLVQKNIAL